MKRSSIGKLILASAILAVLAVSLIVNRQHVAVRETAPVAEAIAGSNTETNTAPKSADVAIEQPVEIASPVVLASMPASRPGKATWRWELSGPTISGAARTETMDEGALVSGFTLSANAAAMDDSLPFRDGRFQATLSAFSPSRPMPGQKPGRWYIEGVWTITDPTASAAALKARHSSAIIRGRIKAELPFNPIGAGRPFDAVMLIPMSMNGGQWAQGKGTWSVDEHFGGTISIPLKTKRMLETKRNSSGVDRIMKGKATS